MLPSMKNGSRQSKISVFLPKVSSVEWQQQMEERRKSAPDHSVQEVSAPSLQIVRPTSIFQKRRPGRPRKPRQLVVDLTGNDTPQA